MDVSEVRGELEELGTAGFQERHGKYYLVLTAPEQVDGFASFVNTASRAANEISAGKSLEGIEILPLVPKKSGAPRVTIGREQVTDLSIVHRKVSKLHAYFTINGGLLSLADGGSKNGTWLNDKLLSPDQPVPVDVGDTVNFGSVSATVWGFEDLLAAVNAGK
jgi:hypothetical protein